MSSPSKRTHPEFLVDTPEYIGISREFEPLLGIATKKLDRAESLQNQWTSEVSIQSQLDDLFAEHMRLEIVIAGWIDQAVLEFHSRLTGDRSCLDKMLKQLDAYRPGENGDICFYLADPGYNKVLATTFSFEDQTLSAAMYRRKPRPVKPNTLRVK